MLAILNDQLFFVQLNPVIPHEFRIEYDPENNRLELLHGSQKVEFGVNWYSNDAKIKGKTGKLSAPPRKHDSFRAVFGGQHLDFTFPA